MHFMTNFKGGTCILVDTRQFEIHRLNTVTNYESSSRFRKSTKVREGYRMGDRKEEEGFRGVNDRVRQPPRAMDYYFD